MPTSIYTPAAPSTLRDVPFSIATTDWVLSNGTYSYTVSSLYITSASKDFVVFDSSVRNMQNDITTTKVYGGGGMTFSTSLIPTGTMSGHIYTIANSDGKTTIIVEDAFIFKPFTVALTPVTNANGAISIITQNEHFTENMKAINLEFGDPTVFIAPVSISTADGQVTMTCTNAIGSSTVTATFVPTQTIDWAQSAPTTVTSAEADILNERISSMKPFALTIDPVTNANGEYTHVTEDARILESMKATAIEVGTPETFKAPIRVTTSNGQLELYCSNAVGSSTVTVTLERTTPVDTLDGYPETVTSEEFDVLAGRIGTLSSLETNAKTDLVSAVNDLYTQALTVEDITNTVTWASGVASTTEPTRLYKIGRLRLLNFGCLALTPAFTARTAKTFLTVAQSDYPMSATYGNLTGFGTTGQVASDFRLNINASNGDVVVTCETAHTGSFYLRGTLIWVAV